MFRYPPTLLIYAGDNLVSDDHDLSPTMNSGTSIRTGEQILLTEILWCCDSILQTLSACNSEAAGGNARCTIGGLGSNGGAGVLGSAVGADSGNNALTIFGGDAMATTNNGGTMGGQLEARSGSSLVTDHRPIHVAMGSRRRRKPLGGSRSLVRVLEELTVEGDISDSSAASGLSMGGAGLGVGDTIGAMRGDDGEGAPCTGSSASLTTSNICGDGSGCDVALDRIKTKKPTNSMKETVRHSLLAPHGGPVTYNSYQKGPTITAPHHATTPLGSDLPLVSCLDVGNSILGVHDPRSGVVQGACDAHDVGRRGAGGGSRDTGGDTLTWVDKVGDLGTGKGVSPNAGGLDARSRPYHCPCPSPTEGRDVLGTSSDVRSMGNSGGNLCPDLHRARAHPRQVDRRPARAHRDVTEDVAHHCYRHLIPDSDSVPLDCLVWLGHHPTHGVVFVGLGTVIVLRLDELASGLAVGALPLKEP
jgi:hypothetical protein